MTTPVRLEYSELVEHIYNMFNESAAKWEKDKNGLLVRRVDWDKLRALPNAYYGALHALRLMGLVSRDDVLDAVCEDSDALRDRLSKL